MKPANALISGLPAQYVIADRAYDADHLIADIEESGGEAVIPPRRHRKVKRQYDKALYKERNQVERYFAKLQHQAFELNHADALASLFFAREPTFSDPT